MQFLPLIRAFAVCMALVACHRTGSRPADTDRSAAITKLAQSVVAQRGVPGIAIAVIRGGKPFQEAIYGVSNLATHAPVTDATPFQLASTTKLFSSTGVLLLVAEGMIDLDDTLASHLDGLPPAWHDVTIRQLLSHTSGLPDITRQTGELDLVADDWVHALPLVAEQPFRFQAGTDWAYTQTNYALLQRLVERLSGMPLEAFLEQRLFQPLGMRNTFFPGPQRQCAVNYQRAHDGRIVGRPELSFPRYVHAAGGLCASLRDLVAWELALDAGKVIPRPLLEEASAPAKLADGSTARIAGSMSYGLGRAIDTTPGHRWVGHSGGNSTAIRRYPDDRLAIIVLHNGTSDPDAIASAVADAMLRQTAGGDAQAELWDAAGDDDQSALEAALQAGADVDALDTRSSHNGRRALNWAAINDHADAIRVLLRHHASIDAANLSGFTALHHAAEAGSMDAAKALLEAGADSSLRTAAGETASDVARRKGHPEIAQLIDGKARQNE